MTWSSFTAVQCTLQVLCSNNLILFLYLLAPMAPAVSKPPDVVKVSESQAEIDLWPVEQRNGPIRLLSALMSGFL